MSEVPRNIRGVTVLVIVDIGTVVGSNPTTKRPMNKKVGSNGSKIYL